MVVAARGGRSGVRECIGTYLSFLLPSLFLLFLLSCPLSLSSSPSAAAPPKTPTPNHQHQFTTLTTFTTATTTSTTTTTTTATTTSTTTTTIKKKTHSLLKCHIFRLFVQIWCNLPFVFVLKIVCLFFVENHRFSKIPVIRKSIRFPWKTMILPMSRAQPNDKFGSGWSQHCLHFSTFWREAMKNWQILHLSIV